ncbi:cytochrome-c peroxidase [Rhabdobacter roseus]|uniref:Cytochrome c peroxidase n=1 Tax=Rhabdobacter roseus TaxID=1655419 RepID=A0A840TX56_9BACT|nr:cytochrome c peroxidase [Rhabdobacter roseus]MBB5286167.1 cytochrome c peroxidase [Rhabdobacter roseus]
MKPLTLFFLSFLGVLAVLACGRQEAQSTQKKEKKPIETLAVLGALPQYVTDPPDNPSSPFKVTLGRLLFYDPILSGNRDVACATCHQPEFNYAEFLETSIGVNGLGSGSKRRFKVPNDIPFVKRNSQSILNAAFNGIQNQGTYRPELAPMFWDLRAKGLEAQALLPIRTLEEMRGHGYAEETILDEVLARIRSIAEYEMLFTEAFAGEPKPINATNVAKALAAYERTLVANNSRFDQYLRGDSAALSTSEKEGLQLFLKAGCAKCHAGPMLSDYQLHTLGVPDSPNNREPDAGIRNDYAFRTPTLRNLRYSAPYMHSGKFATLEQVLQFYEDLSGGKIVNPHVRPDQMDPLVKELKVNFRDISRIVEFLGTLNDDNFDKTVPDRVPSGLKVRGNVE